MTKQCCLTCDYCHMDAQLWCGRTGGFVQGDSACICWLPMQKRNHSQYSVKRKASIVQA